MATKAKARATTTKAAWYGSHDTMMNSATLKGNIGRVLKSKENGVTYIALSGEKKADVTKGLKKLCGDAEIEYHNPIVCRKRKGSIVQIDGITRIWVGVVSGVAEEAKPEKTAKTKKAAKKAERIEKISKEDAMKQIAAMQEQINKLMEVL